MAEEIFESLVSAKIISHKISIIHESAKFNSLKVLYILVGMNELQM